MHTNERGSRHEAQQSWKLNSSNATFPTSIFNQFFSHFVCTLCRSSGRVPRRVGPAPPNHRPFLGRGTRGRRPPRRTRAYSRRTARWGRAGCSRRARWPPRRGRRWGRNRRPGTPPAGRRRAEYEGQVRSRRRRARGRSTCPGSSSARSCARRSGPGRGARRAAAPAWPSWAPPAPFGAAGEVLSVSRPFLVVLARCFFSVLAFRQFSSMKHARGRSWSHGRRHRPSRRARAEPRTGPHARPPPDAPKDHVDAPGGPKSSAVRVTNPNGAVDLAEPSPGF